jgi:putative serine protease PepD
VDGRGYFLTAAHGVAHKFVYLFIFDSSNTYRLRARIVWQGNARKGGPDFAILHVAGTIGFTFDLADEVRKDEPVMAVGLSWTKQPGRNLRGYELMGGRVLNFSSQKGEAGGFMVTTDVPIQPGDSGGPLVDAEGRLVGINVQVTSKFTHLMFPERKVPSLSVSPNRKWLREIIEADVASRGTPY